VVKEELSKKINDIEAAKNLFREFFWDNHLKRYRIMTRAAL